jgi:hypothetical protein
VTVLTNLLPGLGTVTRTSRPDLPGLAPEALSPSFPVPAVATLRPSR